MNKNILRLLEKVRERGSKIMVAITETAFPGNGGQYSIILQDGSNVDFKSKREVIIYLWKKAYQNKFEDLVENVESVGTLTFDDNGYQISYQGEEWLQGWWYDIYIVENTEHHLAELEKKLEEEKYKEEFEEKFAELKKVAQPMLKWLAEQDNASTTVTVSKSALTINVGARYPTMRFSLKDKQEEK